MHRRILSSLTAVGVLAVGLGLVPISSATAAPVVPVAPGAPGVAATWTSGDKHGLGTATADSSKVWYTLGAGTTTEVFYPTVDRPQVQDLQYVVADGASRTYVERDDTVHETTLVDPEALEYRQTDTAKDGSFRITKTYVTSPSRQTLLIATRFEQLSGTTPLHLYVLFNPSTGGDGNANRGGTVDGMLTSQGGSTSAVLASSLGFGDTTTGYSGTASDPYRQLTADHRLSTLYGSAATDGNVVQSAEIPVGRDTSFTLALGFGSTLTDAQGSAAGALGDGFAATEAAYVTGWHGYLASLSPAPSSVTGTSLETQYDVAVMTLRAHEDKTYRGGFVASLSVPWGQSVPGDLHDPGYHAVWARDLYQTATALLAAGDRAAAGRALDYMLTVQQRPDGSMPHNIYVDGRDTSLTVIQLDEVAVPAILASMLGRSDRATWSKLKLSADYLLAHGPSTPQERWEEQAGFSPSTIANEIASLVAAADIAAKNGDTASAARYRDTADLWRASLESWTVTHSGAIPTAHYERIDGAGAPDDSSTICDSNGAGCLDERELVDAGFLELVRLGIRAADDPTIAASVSVTDARLRVETPSGPMWRRYNLDGYGEHADGSPFTKSPGGIGRPWPVLAGERGEYELANGRDAMPYLRSMAQTANDAYMIPEQVWDSADTGRFTAGEATDSAAPLAWAMAQYVRLAQSISAGRNVDTPAVVTARYATGVEATFRANATTTWGESVFVVGSIPALGGWDTSKAIRLSSAAYPDWAVEVALPAGVAIEYKYIRKSADGRVTWESGANRTVTLPGSGSPVYRDTWRP